jgi:hypothetical protein
MVDGRAKLPYCKVLVKPLVSGYVSVFETSCLIQVNFLTHLIMLLILNVHD